MGSVVLLYVVLLDGVTVSKYAEGAGGDCKPQQNVLLHAACVVFSLSRLPLL
jgi:hypothetical protein